MKQLWRRFVIFLVQPTMPVGPRTSRSFWLGVGAAFSLNALIQDWYGQAGWIELLENHWTHMHWAWWLIPLVLIIAAQMFNRVAAEIQAKDNGDEG